MRRLHWLGLATLAIGCGGQDANCLAKLGCRLGDAAQAVATQQQQRLWEILPAADGPDGRVARRLQWDKMLAPVELQVQAVDGGVELRGQVRSEEQRRRAVELAESTVGVEQVRDLLEVKSTTDE